MSPFVLDCAILEKSNDIVSFKASLLLRSRNRKRVLLMKEGYENSFASVIWYWSISSDTCIRHILVIMNLHSLLFYGYRIP